jgi:hypothetical protein
MPSARCGRFFLAAFVLLGILILSLALSLRYGIVGFSLSELLVALLVTTIVTGVAFTLYRTASSHYLREDAYINQQQNLRAAIYLLSRDLRAAGNGLSVVGQDMQLIQAVTPSRLQLASGSPPSINPVEGLFKYPDTSDIGFRDIYGIDGGEDYPDALTVFRTEIEYPVSLGQVEKITVSSGEIELSKPMRDGTLLKGDILVVANGKSGVLLESDTEVPIGEKNAKKIEFKQLGRFYKAGVSPGDYLLNDPVFTEGAQVYNLRDVSLVTYYVDQENNNLMAAYHDQRSEFYDDPGSKSVILASNIEDLQLYYIFENAEVNLDFVKVGQDISYKAFTAEKVKAVAIGVTSRSPYGEGPANQFRPALFNHKQGSVLDNRRRAQFIELVALRNTVQDSTSKN